MLYRGLAMGVRHRPNIIQSISDLENYYWLKNDLIKYAAAHNLVTSGSKKELEERIRVYLTEGRAVGSVTSRSKIRDSHGEIHRDTLVRNYHNDAVTRSFFKHEIGKTFKFNTYLRQFTDAANITEGLTYGDLVVGWYAFEQQKKDKGEQIAPQFEYNQFVRDFYAEHKNASIKEVIAAWNIVKSYKGANTYKVYQAIQEESAVKGFFKDIEVVPYDDHWPKQFAVEEQLLTKALGDNFIAIHHIGSTAVPGLAAKPKIDIIAVVADATKTISQLETCGYEYRGEWNIPGKYGFTKRSEVSVNLHVYLDMHPEIECNLLFRDYLRKHIDVREEYAQLKQSLLANKESMRRVQTSLNFPRYTLQKGLFVQKVLKQAGFVSARILKPTMDIEWEYLQQNGINKDRHSVICYRGVDIVGYAVVDEGVSIVLDDNNADEGLYRRLIDEWLSKQ